MGKLTIVGHAEREVCCDTVEITATFYAQQDTTAKAIETMMEQSEQFLELITAAGIDSKNIHIGHNSIRQDYNRNHEVYVAVSRELRLKLPFDMPFINGLMDLIHQQNFSVDLSCDYELTNRRDLHTELMREALADSRAKADAIAAMMGQKITGIDSVDYNKNSSSSWDDMIQERKIPYVASAAPRLSDKIEPRLIEESESIKVVWLIE